LEDKGVELTRELRVDQMVSSPGWRWVFWLLTIIGGAIRISAFIFMRETYATTILAHKRNASKLLSKLIFVRKGRWRRAPNGVLGH